MNDNEWVVVLAGGDGTRLRSVTTRPDGTLVPKQFCTFGTSQSLMSATLRRARGIAPPNRILPVVAEAHRSWWAEEVAHLPEENVVVQPRNRGTASGLLLPLLWVMSRDPEAVVAVLPSDHRVDADDVLLASVRQAMRGAAEESTSVFLLGVTPDAPETEYGWILPTVASRGAARGVSAFIEKPDRETARALMSEGASWSSFIMVGRVGAFLHLFYTAAPALLRAFLEAATRSLTGPGGVPSQSLRDLYDALVPIDFSRDVLQVESTRSSLRVVAVPHCGWSDLGTPDRVAQWMKSRQTA